MIFIDFRLILGARFESLYWHRGLKFQFVFGLVSRSLLIPILESKVRLLGFLIPDFCIEVIAQNSFSQKSFFIDFEAHFCCCLEALGTVFLIFVA